MYRLAIDTGGTFTDFVYQDGDSFKVYKSLSTPDDRARAVRAALEAGRPADAFDAKQSAALAYARTLTLEPRSLRERDIETLRAAGWDDGEILEINQVVAYFNYANRFVLGVGIETEGDILGLSPGDSSDPENWRHG